MILKTYLAAALFLVLTLSLNAQRPSSEKINRAREHFNEGVRLGIEENFKQAVAEFEKSIDLNPLFAEAYLYKGLAMIELQDYVNAVKNLTITIELDPSFSDQAHYFRGLAKYYLGEYESAIDDFSIAIRMNPDFVAFYQRGKANLKLAEYRRALQDFEIAVRLQEDFYEGNLYRGIALYYLKMYDDALLDLEIAKRQLPHNAMAWYYSGLVRLELRNSYVAVEDLNRAIELDPSLTHASQAREEARRNTTAGRQELSERRTQQQTPAIQQQVAVLNQQADEPAIRETDERPSVTDINFANLFGIQQDRTEATPTEQLQSQPQQTLTVGRSSEAVIMAEPERNVSTDPFASGQSIPSDITQIERGTYNQFLHKANARGFGVQVASYSHTGNLIELAEAYSGKYAKPVFINVSMVNGRKLYKLIIGQFDNRSEAESFRNMLRNDNFPDSFLVVFENL